VIQLEGSGLVNIASISI